MGETKGPGRGQAGARLVLVAGKDPLAKPGGHSSYVRAHARAAVRLGFEPHIFCAAPRAGVAETEFGVVHRVASPFRPFRQIMAPGHAPLVAAGIVRFLEGEPWPGPHVVHGFGVWGWAGVTAGRRLRRKGVTAVPIVSAYTTYAHEAAGKVLGLRGGRQGWQGAWHRAQLAWVRTAVDRFERRAYLGSRLVLVNYDSVGGLVREQYGPGVRLRKLPYATEAAFRDPSHEGEPARPGIAAAGVPLVVAVSRHDPRKGVDVLLRALAMLRDGGVPFRAALVGGGVMLGAHQRLVRDLRLEGCVALEGWVPDSYAYLRGADVFVLPSLEEGSGSLSLLEAMQAGVAIVASDLDGIPEDVTPGEDGLLVPPGDAAALADALRTVLADRALRQRLGARARETFAARFSAAAFVEALGAVYAECGLRPPRPSSPGPSSATAGSTGVRPMA